MPDLGAYLANVGGVPWQWGRHDCCTFPADWLVLCGRPDPMAAWRGAYDSEESCAAILKKAGGLLPLVSQALGEPSGGEPRQGDVGVLHVWGHEAGGIFTGRRWAFRTDKGWVAATFGPNEVAATWAS